MKKRELKYGLDYTDDAEYRKMVKIEKQVDKAIDKFMLSLNKIASRNYEAGLTLSDSRDAIADAVSTTIVNEM